MDKMTSYAGRPCLKCRALVLPFLGWIVIEDLIAPAPLVSLEIIRVVFSGVAISHR